MGILLVSLGLTVSLISHYVGKTPTPIYFFQWLHKEIWCSRTSLKLIHDVQYVPTLIQACLYTAFNSGVKQVGMHKNFCRPAKAPLVTNAELQKQFVLCSCTLWTCAQMRVSVVQRWCVFLSLVHVFLSLLWQRFLLIHLLIYLMFSNCGFWVIYACNNELSLCKGRTREWTLQGFGDALL